MAMRKFKLMLGLVVAAGGLLLTGAMLRPSHMHAEGQPYHSKTFRMAYGGLPDTTNSLFTGSGKCAGCHGKDPNHFASIAGQTVPLTPMPDGWDVNVTDDWRSSLMANSAKDPFWKAKVRHEVLVNPSHQLDLEDKCTSCHAPLGHFAAHHDGEPHYTMAALAQDSLAMDGVSCLACHQQSQDAGSTFSGELTFDDSMAYGPYGAGKDELPLYDLPMVTYTGYTPAYGDHIASGEICAGCHSLVTQTTDLEGNYTGADYVEQATYHEWLNSAYADDGEDPQTCNACHLPRIDEPVVISSGYVFLEPRTPYGLHYMVGGNAQMLEIMRDNVDVLGLSASAEQFDSTLVQTRKMLREQTLDLEILASDWVETSGGNMELKITNKAGHKFPSGYPARRAWVEVKARIGDETIWHSGAWSSDNGSIIGLDDAGLSTYEPHYNVISEESQVQIYELVAADVTGSPTNLLERAAFSLKDNRLTPKGFSYDHAVYDTTRVEGLAFEDESFDVADGSDIITYQFPPSALGGEVEVDVKVWYQAMPPRWINSMFEFQDSTIQAFQSMFEEQGAAPELVKDTTFVLDVLGGVNNRVPSERWAIYPNPSQDGRVKMLVPQRATGALWEVYGMDGSRVASGWTTPNMEIQLPEVQGTYAIRWHLESGDVITRKAVVRH